MVRPLKKGLEYFPHDVDSSNDEKIEALRTLYGNDGYAFYFIMLERIYRSDNFEIVVTDTETMQILSRKVGVTIELFEKMLKTALKWECFDKEAYENKGVLTSQGIKRRASVVVGKRKAQQERYKNKVSGVVTGAETREET